MKLFFETSAQAYSFLAAVPVGFGTALCLDVGKRENLWRVVLDLLLLLLCGYALLVLVFALQEDGLRMYHLLGVTTGGLLYMRGIGSIKRGILSIKKRHTCKRDRQDFLS